MCCSKAGVGRSHPAFLQFAGAVSACAQALPFLLGAAPVCTGGCKLARTLCKHVLGATKELEDTEKYNLHSINLKFHS